MCGNEKWVRSVRFSRVRKSRENTCTARFLSSRGVPDSRFAKLAAYSPSWPATSASAIRKPAGTQRTLCRMRSSSFLPNPNVQMPRWCRPGHHIFFGEPHVDEWSICSAQQESPAREVFVSSRGFLLQLNLIGRVLGKKKHECQVNIHAHRSTSFVRRTVRLL